MQHQNFKFKITDLTIEHIDLFFIRHIEISSTLQKTRLIGFSWSAHDLFGLFLAF